LPPLPIALPVAPVAIATSAAVSSALGPLRTFRTLLRALLRSLLRTFRPLIARDVVDVLVVFQEVRHVQERVPLQSQIHERRLHPGQNACDASFMNAPGERVFVGALEVHLAQLVLFE
jgi:hypothetical protein